MRFPLIIGSYGVGGGSGGGGGGGGGPVTTATATFSPDTTTRFVNPECGPYGWVYTNSASGQGGSWLHNFTSSNLSGLRSASFPRTLVMAFIDGTANLSTNFSTAQINAFRTALGLVRNAGLMAITRVCYNYDGGGADANLAQQQAHMAQLQQTFTDYVDVIFVDQMGGAGAYAEFHDGTSGIDANQSQKLALMQAHMQYVHTDIPIQSRYPADTMTWFPTVITQAQWLSGLTTPTNQTRLGGFNDGYLAGSSDSGTFDNRPGTSGSTGSVTTKQNYLKAQSLYTPTGGEVTTYAGSPYRTSYADATGDGSAYHMDFLNYETSSGPAFFSAWSGNGADQQISKYYGYRIQLDSLTYPTSSTARGASAAFTITLRNNGYSRIHRLRQLQVVLKHTSTGEIYTANADDLRKLDPNATSSTTFTATLGVPSGATAGNYTVYLAAPSRYSSVATDTRYAVRFANTNNGGQAWDGTAARWNTGATITVT